MLRLSMLLFFAIALPVSAADSYVFVNNGQTITNGAPVNNKAIKARFSGSFLWFSIDGKSYVARDPEVLKRLKDVYAPLFESGDWTLGEQATLLDKQMDVLKAQLRNGLEPRPGEDAAAKAQRVELRYQQNRLAERQNELAQRANEAAQLANEHAAQLDDINHQIELHLHDIATQLIAQKIAVRSPR